MFTEQPPEFERSPQARRLAQTREAILQNARQMIVAQGIEGLSLRALADSIDYTPGALYKYFSSKEALVDAVRADCFEELNSSIAEQVLTAVTTPDMLLLGGLAYIEYARQHPQEYHLMFNMEPSQATSGEQRAIAMRTLLQIVQLGVPRGKLWCKGRTMPPRLPTTVGPSCTAWLLCRLPFCWTNDMICQK